MHSLLSRALSVAGALALAGAILTLADELAGSWALLALGAVAAKRPEGPKPTQYQEAILAVPEDFDLCLAGGRGPGKSWALLLLALRHSIVYGGDAATLYVRQTLNGASEWIRESRLLFGQVAPEATFNQATRLWTFPNGASIEVGHLEVEADFRRYQGRSFTQVLVDETQQWPGLDVLELLRSCLRAAPGVPTRMALAANPGGPGHSGLARRFVLAREPWVPFEDANSKTSWVLCPGTFKDNPHLDQAAYLRQLEASTANDAELRKAWINGDWAVARGAYFADVIDMKRHALDGKLWSPEEPWCKRAPLDLFLGYDHGSARPAVALVIGYAKDTFRGPDERLIVKGSFLALDELVTLKDHDQLNAGSGETVPEIARRIHDLCGRWDMRAQGCGDAAIFQRHGSASGSIGDEFRAAGIRFDPSTKCRRPERWSKLRSLLNAAGSVDEPALYISTAGWYLWQTIPTIPCDPRNPEDVLSTGTPDHGLDALGYGILYEPSVPDYSYFRL